MALEKTKLTKEKIIDIVTNDYGLLGIIQINYINRGTSNIFQVIVNDKKYILKEFNSERTIEYIEKEINIINFLSTKGISVPRYIQLKNGEYYTKYQDRIIIMQEFIEGEVLEDNSANHEQLIKSAKLLGKLIKTLEKHPDLDDEDIINQKFSKRYLLDAIEKIKIEKNKINTDNKYKEIFIKDYETKIGIAQELANNFNFEIINKLTIKNTHGDYCNLQLIYNNKEDITVIDFETAKKMPIIWDIMRSYCYMDKEAKDGIVNIENLKEYVKEVNKYIKLNKYDLKYAADIFLIQLIGSVFGYREYNKDYNQKNLLRFALFRTKICKDLYKNSNKISKELLKILEEEKMKKVLIATRNKDKFATIKQVLSKMAKEEYSYYSLYDIEGLDKDEKESGTVDKRAYDKANQIYQTIENNDFEYIIGIDDGIKLKGVLRENVKDYLYDIIDDKYLSEGEQIEIVRAYCFMDKNGEYKSTITEIPFKYKKYNGKLKIEANTYPLSHVLTPVDSDIPVSDLSNEDDINYCFKYTEPKLKELFK